MKGKRLKREQAIGKLRKVEVELGRGARVRREPAAERGAQSAHAGRSAALSARAGGEFAPDRLLGRASHVQEGMIVGASRAMDGDAKLVSAWLVRCLRGDVALRSCREVGRGTGCRVWECEVGDGRLMLKLYSPGFDDYSRLGPLDTARKHALALDELPRFGVPTPRCLGFAASTDEAALVMERLAAVPFIAAHRVEAARILARLHMIELSDLSLELADLVSRSTPNRGRVGEAPDEPPLREITVQHGDYFSVNIIAAPEGPRVLDWDLLALGDPMWDLGFLLCADRGVTEQDAEAVIAAYEELRPAATERLAWQRRCWQLFWRERETHNRA